MTLEFSYLPKPMYDLFEQVDLQLKLFHRMNSGKLGHVTDSIWTKILLRIFLEAFYKIRKIENAL